MNESKLLKNHNKCPMVTTNLNEKKNAKFSVLQLVQILHSKSLGLFERQFLDYLIIINVP